MPFAREANLRGQNNPNKAYAEVAYGLCALEVCMLRRAKHVPQLRAGRPVPTLRNSILFAVPSST